MSKNYAVGSIPEAVTDDVTSGVCREGAQTVCLLFVAAYSGMVVHTDAMR